MKKDDGFTLIEVVVAVAIFTILMLAINYLFVSLYRQQGTSIAMVQRTQTFNVALDTMARELREGNRGENGHYFIETAGENSLVFYSDIDGDDLTEKVTYALVGAEFRKTVAEPGADALYGGTPATSIICAEIQNDGVPIFTYYDENYTGAGAAMTLPAPVLEIKLIGVSLTANTAKFNRSYPLHIETKIKLRNSL